MAEEVAEESTEESPEESSEQPAAETVEAVPNDDEEGAR